jgi:hypothetical protein
MPVKSGQTGQDLKFAFDTATTASAADTINTGLRVCLGAVACFQTDPGDANVIVSAVPVAGTGNFTLKTWKTDGTDPTPAAADTFSKAVSWFAWGF